MSALAVTAPEKKSEGERTILQFELINLSLAVLATVLVHVLMGPGPFLWGTLVGGVLGVLNLRSMVFVGRRILVSQNRSRVAWALVFTLKLVLLCTIVWLCLSQLPIDSIGFLVGFSTMLPSTLVLTAVRALERAPTAVTKHGERRL